MDFSRVQEHLEKLVHDGAPFVQTVVTQGRKTVFNANVGWADAEKTVPITERHLCWCYSNTKVYTAVSLMRLVEAGKVALDDPVSRYLPEFAEIRCRKNGEVVQSKQAPTLRQLITMTSGLTYNLGEYPHFSEAIARPGVTTREAIAALAQEVLAFEPGTDYCYGLGHDVIAAVVEVASGLRFSEYVRQNLLDPLGIEDSGFHPTAEQLARFAMEYRWDGEVYTPCGAENKYAFSENYDSGGAGLFSCPKEYGKLLTALACGGTGEDGYLVLKPETIDLMTQNQLSGKAWETYHTRAGNKNYRAGYGYAHGVRVHVDDAVSGCKTSVGEFGWSGAAGAYSVVDRKRQLAISYAEHVLRGTAVPKPAADGSFPYIRTQVLKTLKNRVCEALDS